MWEVTREGGTWWEKERYGGRGAGDGGRGWGFLVSGWVFIVNYGSGRCGTGGT